MSDKSFFMLENFLFVDITQDNFSLILERQSFKAFPIVEFEFPLSSFSKFWSESCDI